MKHTLYALLMLLNMTPTCASEKPVIAVILGTVREARIGPMVGKQVVQKLEAKGNEVILIDPVEYSYP